MVPSPFVLIGHPLPLLQEGKVPQYVGSFSSDSCRPDDRLAGRSSFIGHPGAKHFGENGEGGKRKEGEPHTKETAPCENHRWVRDKEIRNGAFLLMDLSLCYQSRSLGTTLYNDKTGCRPRHPASVLVPGSALGLLPSMALSSAQAMGMVPEVARNRKDENCDPIKSGNPREKRFRFVLCPSTEPESNWPRATFLNRTARGNGFVSSAANPASDWHPALASANAGRASIGVWCRHVLQTQTGKSRRGT